MTAVHALHTVCALQSTHALPLVYALHAVCALRASLPDSLTALPVVCAVQACNPLAHPGKVTPVLHLQCQPISSTCLLVQVAHAQLLCEDFLSHVCQQQQQHKTFPCLHR